MRFKGDRKKMLVPLRGKDKSIQWESIEYMVTIEETYKKKI